MSTITEMVSNYTAVIVALARDMRPDSHEVRTALEDFADDVADAVIASLLTTEQVAAQLGVTVRRVRALAAARGVGIKVDGGLWLFRAEDVERLRPGPVGRPKATK